MSDVIIEELWKIKDNIAQEHGYNLDLLVAYLKGQELSAGQKVVTLCARKTAGRVGKARRQRRKNADRGLSLKGDNHGQDSTSSPRRNSAGRIHDTYGDQPI